MKSTENEMRMLKFSLLILFLSAGCSSLAPRNMMPTITVTPLPTVATMPTHVYQVKQRCIQIVQSAPPAINGSLILHTNRQGESPNTYLLNLMTGARIRLGDLIGETVSPDGSKLAYWDLDLKSVIIADARGSKLKEISDPDERLSPAGWLDNQRLMLDRRRKEFNGPYIVDSLIILDLLTGKQQEWLPEYPNFNNHINEVYWIPSSRLIINPKFSYLIYPSLEGGLPVILWDIDSQSMVARIYNGNRISTPQWSPDRTQFVISAPPRIGENGVTYLNINDGLPFNGGTDLFLVRRTGEVNRLTYFTTSHEAWQEHYSWSPDGKDIAFLLQDGRYAGMTSGDLFVMNTETGEMTNYCLQGIPMWSTDGQYIILTQIDDKLQNHVILIDLQNAQAWQIAEDGIAMGWMVNEP